MKQLTYDVTRTTSCFVICVTSCKYVNELLITRILVHKNLILKKTIGTVLSMFILPSKCMRLLHEACTNFNLKKCPHPYLLQCCTLRACREFAERSVKNNSHLVVKRCIVLGVVGTNLSVFLWTTTTTKRKFKSVIAPYLYWWMKCVCPCKFIGVFVR